MTAAIAVDTSVAVPLVMASHLRHKAVSKWWAGRSVALSGHALAETFSVLTRLPGDARLEPDQAAVLLDARFEQVFLPGPTTARDLHRLLAALGIAGGAVYDALVGLAARDNGVALATRDARARPTYERLGVNVIEVG